MKKNMLLFFVLTLALLLCLAGALGKRQRTPGECAKRI